MATLAIEKGPNALRSVETSKLIVRQPAKLAELSKLLETFDNLSARVGERVSEGNSGDWSGASGTAGTTQGDDDGISPRDKAINAIPAPEVQRQKLEHHIQGEMRKLERLARRKARSSKPGAACTVNELYSRIRRMNALLSQILEASMEVLKRLFIRVFVDRQPII